MRAPPLTVFVGTFNRTSTLERTIRSFQRFPDCYQLVIVDNGSDWEPAVRLLGELERHPLVAGVYQLGPIETMEQLTANFDVAISDVYRRRPRSPWFAVTDADVCFEGTTVRALQGYVRVARRTGYAVGPHTRVDASIPWHYPLRSRILATESATQYRRDHEWCGRIPFSHWPIDTTFHVFRAESQHRRLRMHTVRCGPPFDAMHLDWYVDVFHPTDENRVYITDERGTVGAWGRRWLRDYWRILQDDGAEAAWRHLEAKPRVPVDLCNASFMRSWALQYGVGVEKHLWESRRQLGLAIPPQSVWAKHAADWTRMIFHGDFTVLGWTDDRTAA